MKNSWLGAVSPPCVSSSASLPGTVPLGFPSLPRIKRLLDHGELGRELGTEDGRAEEGRGRNREKVEMIRPGGEERKE